jgi:uncharacterized protein YfdQ (DUF2303 family)
MSGEVQALINALAQDAAVDTRLREPGELSERAIPPGWQVLYTDNERLLDNPRRALGEVKVRSAKGFIDAVKQRWPAGTPDDPAKTVTIYADDAHQTLIAILNDDLGSTAGWRDHRVALDVSKTEEWKHWMSHQGMKSQEAFAEAIELGQLEITDPSPALMLRIAETFEATVGVTFKKGAQVRDGAQQYVYEETIDAKAAGGTVEVPEGFTITVAPYIGSPRYVVKARLKTRLVSGKFTIGYVLERPEEVERAAFRDIATQVATDLNLTAIEGVAPPPR